MGKIRGQRCGDIEMTVYLSNVSGPVPLVMDLRITYEIWGSRSNPSLDGHLHYPTDIDRTLNEDDTDKVLQYRVDYNNRPSHTIVFFTVMTSTSGRIHDEFVCLLFLQDHRETDYFLTGSGVHLEESHFHFHRSVFSSHLKSKVGHILVKDTPLQIMLNIVGTPMSSRSITFRF